MTTSIYKQLEVHADRIIERFKEDFTVHDAESLSLMDKPGFEFIWVVNNSGTHINHLNIPDDHSASWQKRNRVSMVEQIMHERPEAEAYLVLVTDIRKDAEPHLRAYGTVTPADIETVRARVAAFKAALPEPRDRGDVLIIKCPDYFNLVQSEVVDAGLGAEFVAAFERLNSYASYIDDYRCLIHQDFAKWSFHFGMEIKKDGNPNWQHFMNGGLIYHESTRNWQTHT